MTLASGLLLPMALAAGLVGQTGTPEFPRAANVPNERGAFARQSRIVQFIEPGVLAPRRPRSDEAPKFRLLADFERRRAVLLVGDRLVEDFPETFAELATAISRRSELLVAVADHQKEPPVRKALAQAGVPGDRARLLHLATDTIWIRDFGSVFIQAGDGGLRALDFDYRRRSGTKARERDDRAAGRIARRLRIPATRVAMTLEGGHLLSNGRGLLLVTTAAINANVARGYTVDETTGYFARAFGCRTIVALEPLRRESTGHVDVFACFTNATTVLVGRYAANVDPVNAAVLDRNAALLRRVRTEGGPLRVERIPMPENDDDCWRTYTNCLFVKPAVLVPSYGGAEESEEAEALATFRRLLPGWQVETIDASRLITREGALRCAALHVPR